MKELERIAKDNGICRGWRDWCKIATMIVKDIVQEMLDDDMIINEKVGSTVLYWIFPSQSYIIVRVRVRNNS